MPFITDSNIPNMKNTKILDYQLIEDKESSSIYICRTQERICNSIRNDIILISLTLDQLGDSWYDTLNQKYLSVDGPKYCKLSVFDHGI